MLTRCWTEHWWFGCLPYFPLRVRWSGSSLGYSPRCYYNVHRYCYSDCCSVNWHVYWCSVCITVFLSWWGTEEAIIPVSWLVLALPLLVMGHLFPHVNICWRSISHCCSDVGYGDLLPHISCFSHWSLQLSLVYRSYNVSAQNLIIKPDQFLIFAWQCCLDDFRYFQDL